MKANKKNIFTSIKYYGLIYNFDGAIMIKIIFKHIVNENISKTKPTNAIKLNMELLLDLIWLIIKFQFMETLFKICKKFYK